MKSRKAQGLSTTVIIIAVLALLVLVVIAVIFTGGSYEDDVALSLNQWTHVAATFNPSTSITSGPLPALKYLCSSKTP